MNPQNPVSDARRLFLAALSAAILISPRAGRTAPETAFESLVPLRAQSLEAVTRDSRGDYRLADQCYEAVKDGMIVVPFSEANQRLASVVAADDENTRRPIAATAGEFFFRVAETGTYHAALVAEFPAPGTWNYSFAFDGGASVESICHVAPGQAKALHVLPLTAMRRELEAGTHGFSISIPGGGRVSALLLRRAPFVAGPVKQAPAARGAAPVAGTIRFAPLDAVGMESVARIAVSNSTGRIVWSALDAGGRGAPVEIAAPPASGPRPVFCATLHRAADGQSAVLRAPMAHVQCAAAHVARLEGGEVALEADRRTGRIGRILSRRGGRSFRRQADLPFRLADWNPELGQLAEFAPDRFVCESVNLAGRRLSLRYRDTVAGAEGRSVRVDIDADGALLRWRMRVDNRAATRVRIVRFPYLSDVAAGDHAADDQLAWCGNALGPAAETPAWHREYHTPQVMFMDLYDEAGGFYFGAHDATGEADRMLMMPSSGPPPFTYAIECDRAIAPGATWKSPEFVVGVHAGDWHAGADIYRAWYDSVPRQSRDPGWLRPDYMGALNVGLSNIEPFGCIADWWRMARWRGSFFLKLNNVGGDGFVNNFYGYPNPRAGGPDALRKAVQWVNARGGQTTAYLNCRYWTPAWADGSLIGHTPRWLFPDDLWLPDWHWVSNNAVRLYGAGPEPVKGGSPHRPFQPVVNMSFRSKGWYAFWKYWFERYAEWGLNIYWDQAMVSAYRCDLPAEHCRWPDANYQQALMRTCRDAKAGALRRKSDFIVRGEGLSDRHMRIQNLCWIFRYPTPIYRYTHPDHVIDMTLYNEDYDVDWQLAYLYHMRITGGRPWGKGWGDDQRRVTDLRAATRDVSHLGRFMDNVGLTGETEAVQARWVLLDAKRRQAVEVHTRNAGGITNQFLELQWPLPIPPRAAFVYRLGTRVDAWSYVFAEGRVRFEAPAAIVSAVLFVADEDPARALRAHAFAPMHEPGRDVLRVALANASDERQAGDVRLDAHPELKAAPAPLPFDLAPGEAVTLDLPFDGTADLRDFAEAPLRITTPRSVLRPSVWVAPTVLNGEFEDDATGDTVIDYWREGVRVPNLDRGGYCLLVPAKGDYSPRGVAQSTVHLRPATTYRVTFEARATTKAHLAIMAYDRLNRPLGQHIVRIAPSDGWERYEQVFTTRSGNDACWSLFSFACPSEDRRDGLWVDAVRCEPTAAAQ